MINVNAFKPGVTFQEDGHIFSVLSASHSKQGRGQANVKAKVKNLRTGATTIKSYTGGDKVKSAHIDKRDMDYLYNDGSNIVLMDQVSFEQVEIALEKVEWELNFLKEGNKVLARFFESEVLDIELPTNVELEVIEAPEAVKGNTQNNPQKKITLETNFVIEAPMFIKQGEIVVVSTTEGKYQGRGGK